MSIMVGGPRHRDPATRPQMKPGRGWCKRPVPGRDRIANFDETGLTRPTRRAARPPINLDPPIPSPCWSGLRRAGPGRGPDLWPARWYQGVRARPHARPPSCRTPPLYPPHPAPAPPAARGTASASPHRKPTLRQPNSVPADQSKTSIGHTDRHVAKGRAKFEWLTLSRYAPLQTCRPEKGVKRSEAAGTSERPV